MGGLAMLCVQSSERELQAPYQRGNRNQEPGKGGRQSGREKDQVERRGGPETKKEGNRF
jgi:hypothetical protein